MRVGVLSPRIDVGVAACLSQRLWNGERPQCVSERRGFRFTGGETVDDEQPG